MVLSNVFELFVGIQEVIEDADGRNKQNTLLALVQSNNKFVQFTVLKNNMNNYSSFARTTLDVRLTTLNKALIRL